jgi:hypothetical protein
MKKLFLDFLEMKNLPLADKALVFVHIFGFSGNLFAWLEQNQLFASNLLFVIIPGSIYALFRFRQKYRHQESLNRIELQIKLHEMKTLTDADDPTDKSE